MFLFFFIASTVILNIFGLSSLSNINNKLNSKPERVYIKEINSLTPIIPKEEFVATLKQCIKTIDSRLSKSSFWISNNKTNQELVNLLNGSFSSPYVQKMLLPPGATIACFGDIHGSAHSLVRSLQHLCNLGYLNDDFSITTNNPHFYFVFLGDTVDRGCYGIEVIYLLMQLIIKNPERVIAIRGNHENVPANRLWGLGSEIHAKYGKAFNINELSRFFTTLPLACYIGCQTSSEKKEFLLCCHGGPDISFNATEILTHSAKLAFQKIEKFLYTSHASKKIASTNPSAQQKKGIDLVKQKAREKGIIWNESKNTTPDNWLMKLGFIWTDLDIEEESNEMIQFTRRCWILGKSLTKALLKTDDANVGVHAVFRGHQHHGALYEKLIKAKGFVQSWDGMVNTLFSGPAAQTFIKTHEKEFDYDSFVMVTTAENTSDWTFTHWYHKLETSSWHSK